MDARDRIRIRHMLDAAKEALSFVRGQNRAALDWDRKLMLSLVLEVEIIGEAASQVSPATRKKHPTIPWQDIIAMRHRLIHAYFDVDLDILWDTIRKDVPSLVRKLEKIQ